MSQTTSYSLSSLNSPALNIFGVAGEVIYGVFLVVDIEYRKIAKYLTRIGPI